MKPYTEKQLVAALKRIEKRWPDGYLLFSWSGSLSLMRRSDMPEDPRMLACQTGRSGSAADAIVEEFGGIPSDGGDPD